MTPAAVERLVERWPAMRSFVAIGALWIVAGGLVAAITRPTGFGTGPWVAAYLVLVGGVAQIALGVGQALLAHYPPPTSTTTIEASSWNVGLGATIGGTLLTTPWSTAIGGLTTVGALVLVLVTVRRAQGAVRRDVYAFRAIVTFVLLGVPAGLVLAWLRHG